MIATETSRLASFACRGARALALALFFVGAPAFAASQQANDAGWEKVDANAMVQPGETMPANKLVAAAYGFIWVMVLGFVGLTWQRARKVETELDELKQRIERART